MKIVIDARMYGLEHAGIGRYVMNLLQQLQDVSLKDRRSSRRESGVGQRRMKPKASIEQIEKLSAKGGPASGWDKKNDYFILLRKKYFRDLKFENKRFKKILADYPHYSLTEQILLPLQLIKLKPDLAHFPHFNVPIFWWGSQVVTIHDLIKHQSKGPATTTRWQPFYWLKYLSYKFIVWLAVKRAARVIVPSKWWKEELVRQYALDPDKILVTYEAVDEKFIIPDSKFGIQNVLKKYSIKKPYLLYVGNLYPHKNVERLVKAVICLNDLNHLNKPIMLVVACSRNVFYKRFKEIVKQMKADSIVNLVGFIAEEKELAVLYSQAKAFVFPSFQEGFGLPGLEAMAAGCPVVCSDIPVLREVYGEAALYFDPHDVDDIARKIKIVTSNKLIRNQLIKKGHQQVKKYSWQKMAQQTLKVYREVS